MVDGHRFMSEIFFSGFVVKNVYIHLHGCGEIYIFIAIVLCFNLYVAQYFHYIERRKAVEKAIRK